MIQKKICMLGAFGVGKTSLVSRFVYSKFSERYLTTVGVKIDRKELKVEGMSVNLVFWDLHGEDEFQKIRSSYLRGMAGYFLVADGTRPETLEVARTLRDFARSCAGDVPCVLLINKCDLIDEWCLENEAWAELVGEGWTVLKTSAKSGENVEQAFRLLAARALHETH